MTKLTKADLDEIAERGPGRLLSEAEAQRKLARDRGDAIEARIYERRIKLINAEVEARDRHS